MQREHEARIWELIYTEEEARAITHLVIKYALDCVPAVASASEEMEEHIDRYPPGSLAHQMLSRMVPKLVAELEGMVHNGICDLEQRLKDRL